VALAMTATMHKSLPPRVYSKAEVESVMIRVTNESNFPIRVVNAGLILQELSKGEMTFGQLLNGPLPKDFAPHQTRNILIPYEDARRAVALSRPVRAWLRLTSNERFVSKEVQLIPKRAAAYEENLVPRRDLLPTAHGLASDID
jgi:hypothetical protein